MNAKTGDLSKRDMDQLKSALKSLDEWIEWQEKHDLKTDDDYHGCSYDYENDPYFIACAAAERLREFINGYEH